MAADREWFMIEKPNGNVVDGVSYPNREAAVEAAKTLAPEWNVPLTVVKYIRREIKTIERVVSIKETDIGAVTPT